ncbi:MAG: hypothetical protein ACLU37_09160, partial [Collinsella sp.]
KVQPLAASLIENCPAEHFSLAGHFNMKADLNINKACTPQRAAGFAAQIALGEPQVEQSVAKIPFRRRWFLCIRKLVLGGLRCCSGGLLLWLLSLLPKLH